MIKYYVDENGAYLGSFTGCVVNSFIQPESEEGETVPDKEKVEVLFEPETPPGAVEVPSAPAHAAQVWDFQSESWGDIPEIIAALGGLIESEQVQNPHRALEDIILALHAGEGVPQRLIDWANNRKNLRSKL